MTTPRDRKSKSRRAYPIRGAGEDFPARRPGTKVGENRRGGKVLQPTNATMNRRAVNAGKAAVAKRAAVTRHTHPRDIVKGVKVRSNKDRLRRSNTRKRATNYRGGR